MQTNRMNQNDFDLKFGIAVKRVNPRKAYSENVQKFALKIYQEA